MTRLEDQVRDALQADAETVRPETIPGVPMRPARRAAGRRRSRRTRILIPLAAAAGVIAVVAGVSLAVPLVSRPGQPAGAPAPNPTLVPSPGKAIPFPTGGLPSSYPVVPLPQPVLGHDGQPASKGVPSSAPSPGVPNYYVTVNEPASVNSLVVRSTASGAVVGTIDPPRGTDFGAVAATSGDRTFITAVSAASNGCAAQTQLYQFQLNEHGVPGPLTPLNIAVPGSNVQYGTLAITPDGHEIAYDTWLCGSNQEAFEVGVISLATGQVRTWEDPDPNQFTMGLSLTPQGTTLVYETQGLPNGDALAIATKAPFGSLPKESVLISRNTSWATLGNNGATLYSCSVVTNASESVGSVTYYAQSLEGTLGQALPAGQSSAGSGRQVIASWNDLPYPQCWASLQPAGDYLLVQYPVAVKNGGDWVQPALLNLATGQLRLIAAPPFYGPADVAW